MSELGWERAFREWVRAAGMGWETLRYPRPAAGGETVAHRLSPAAPPRGLVLAVHGAGNDSLFAWVGLFKQLLRRGHEVFTFDLDGHGRTSSTCFAAEAVGDAVQSALDASGAAARGLPVHAVGVSLGGAVLLHSLPALSPRPASAVLVCAPLRVQLSRGAVLNELRPGLLAALWRGREHYGGLGLVPSFGPFKRGAYPLRLAEPRPGAFGYVAALNECLDGLRLEEAARRADLPVLLVYGTADRLVPLAQAERLRGRLPRAELLAVPGATHLTVPLVPAAVERVLGWIEEVQSAKCKVQSAADGGTLHFAPGTSHRGREEGGGR